MIRFRAAILVLAQVFALSTSLSGPFAAPLRTLSAAPTPFDDNSELVVGGGTVTDFTHNDTVLYWHSSGSCFSSPKLRPSPTNVGDIQETVSRVSTIGTSPDRQIYAKDLRATNGCKPYVFSQVVADADYLYWVDASGLVKLSKNANPGDAPQVLNASFTDQKPYQITSDSTYVYLSRDSYAVCGAVRLLQHPPAPNQGR